MNLRIQETQIYTRATLNIYHCGDDSGEVHLFSYRTQKLSSLAPTILCWRRHGKIGSCCIQKERHQSLTGAFLFGSDYRCFPPSRWLGERFTVSNNVMLPLRDLQLLIMLDCLVQSEKYPRYAVIMSVSNNLHSKDIEW